MASKPIVANLMNYNHVASCDRTVCALAKLQILRSDLDQSYYIGLYINIGRYCATDGWGWGKSKKIDFYGTILLYDEIVIHG